MRTYIDFYDKDIRKRNCSHKKGYKRTRKGNNIPVYTKKNIQKAFFPLGPKIAKNCLSGYLKPLI